MKHNVTFYGEDLAYVHHQGFSDFAGKAGDALLKLFRRNGLKSGVVIDLGCGSGIWAEKLVASGYDVLGVDVSEKMIQLARRNAPAAEFRVGSLYDIALQPCVAVTIMGEGLNYAYAGAPSETSLKLLFKRIAASLCAGGIFVFDVIVQTADEPLQYRTWQKGKDWAVLVEVSEDVETSKLERAITVFRADGDRYRRSEEVHKVHLFKKEEVRALLTASGFEVEITTAYGDYELAQRRLVYIARKSLE